MDEQRFDSLAKTLAVGVSRRRVLRGAAAGLAAAAVGLRATRAGAGPKKTPVCHYTGSATNPWEVIEVAEPAYLTHIGHGDQPFVDCCGDAECANEFETCGGGGTVGACGCTPTFTAATCDGATCGDFADGCGGTVPCGCVGTETCGGGGVSGECGCTPTFTAADCDGEICGEIANGCGATVICGCTGSESCGGGGVDGMCGCTDDGTACGAAVCGEATNNCGVTVVCGPLNGTCPNNLPCQDGVCPPAGPQALQLYGTRRGDGLIFVDDDLRVELNGAIIFNDADNTFDNHPPISFTASNGDTLRIVATNGTLPGFHFHLDPLALRRVSDGATQVLDALGADAGPNGGPIGVLYDRTFTIALP